MLVCDARSLLVQSLIKDLWSLSRLPEPALVHLELRRLLFELLKEHFDNQYLLADHSTHKPLLQFTTGGFEAGNDTSYSSLEEGGELPRLTGLLLMT